MAHHFLVQLITEDELEDKLSFIASIDNLLHKNIWGAISVIYRDEYLQIMKTGQQGDFILEDNVTEQIASNDETLDKESILKFVTDNFSEKGNLEIRFRTQRHTNEGATQKPDKEVIAEFSFIGKEVRTHNLSLDNISMLYHQNPYQLNKKQNVLQLDFGPYYVYSLNSVGQIASRNIELIVSELEEVMTSDIRTMIGKLDQNTITKPDEWSIIYHKYLDDFTFDFTVLGYDITSIDQITIDKIESAIEDSNQIDFKKFSNGGMLVFHRSDLSGNISEFYTNLYKIASNSNNL